MSLFGYIKDSIKKYFFAGLLVIVPLIITYVVLRFFLTAIDGLLSPLLIRYLGYEIPGLGIVITVILIFAAGILTHGVVGRGMVRFWERILSTLPLVRTVYTASKQLMSSISESKNSTFQRVVIIPYPRQGMYCFGFAAKEVSLDNQGVGGNFVTVFVPSTPTPFSGFVVMVKKEELYPTDISVEAAVKFIVSGGIVLPDKLIPAGARISGTT